MSKVAAVEGVQVFLRAVARHFQASTICNTTRTGVAECDNSAVVGISALSLGDPVVKG